MRPATFLPTPRAAQSLMQCLDTHRHRSAGTRHNAHTDFATHNRNATLSKKIILCRASGISWVVGCDKVRSAPYHEREKLFEADCHRRMSDRVHGSRVGLISRQPLSVQYQPLSDRKFPSAAPPPGKHSDHVGDQKVGPYGSTDKNRLKNPEPSRLLEQGSFFSACDKFLVFFGGGSNFGFGCV